jgi:predicted GNAT superfamily acetyltransferase
VVVRHLDQAEQFRAGVALLCKIWNAETPEDLINASTLTALSMSGQYVTGAYLGGEMVGMAIAFRGRDHVHSHIVGVHPGWQGSGVGYQIKRHQGEWARAEGLPAVRWTFDPLVRGNAHFNVAKLGGRVLSYHEDLYGPLSDGIDGGEETDRLLVEWTVPENAGRPPATAFFPAGPTGIGAVLTDGAPERVTTRFDRPEGTFCLIATPGDILGIRRTDPRLARRWRLAVRAAFQGALRDGFRHAGFTADGCYVLRRAA